MPEIKLGDRVRDSITGFTGIAVARIEYLNGCRRFQVQPEMLHEGKIIEAEWVDAQQLGDFPEATNGGPGAVPPPREPRSFA